MTRMLGSKQACDLILFGTLGDLASRKLLPALYQLEKAGLLHADMQVTGVAREELDHQSYLNIVEDKLQQFIGASLETDVWQRLQQRLNYVKIDLRQTTDYEKLLTVTQSTSRVPVSYFATPPSLFGQISQGLSLVGLAQDNARVVLEKPIGHNLSSSIVINDEVSNYFNENQIYRIDHYLGKETVLNLLVLRFANPIFSSHWDNTAIDHVQITVAEEVGVEGRWGVL
ncbi:glucose-6-phosphate 1-dehydrogenase [Legionella jamestowniensis]|uniref:Glucose-6-phosphate 1-dehydrogenase n=1 Tax=Legionella jamestowniensis TaxID=455 RepID=A0A0W0UNI0_9GAMM|nr:hypothetical protein [Legionella jamestowniensis]KTD09384.1 glucose-6-phosphate 1-dehydrogenase [Legionella jamestowniensis]